MRDEGWEGARGAQGRCDGWMGERGSLLPAGFGVTAQGRCCASTPSRQCRGPQGGGSPTNTCAQEDGLGPARLRLGAAAAHQQELHPAAGTGGYRGVNPGGESPSWDLGLLALPVGPGGGQGPVAGVLSALLPARRVAPDPQHGRARGRAGELGRRRLQGHVGAGRGQLPVRGHVSPGRRVSEGGRCCTAHTGGHRLR